MSLTLNFTTAKDLLSKLERDATVIQDSALSPDSFFNFILTSYALIDWIKNDPTVPSQCKTHSVISGVYNYPAMKICGDIANSIKHFSLKYRKPIVSSTSAIQGFDVGGFGKGGYGVGESRIDILLNDGSVIDAIDFTNNVLCFWRSFFSQHNI